jgi:hypothetical protein
MRMRLKNRCAHVQCACVRVEGHLFVSYFIEWVMVETLFWPILIRELQASVIGKSG